MALPDLLWACPECGRDRGLAMRGREAVCAACGARYARARGSLIRRTAENGSKVVRSPAEWVERLPAVDSVLDPTAEGLIRSARVRAREVVDNPVVRHHGTYLNRVERFGDEEAGTLRLHTDRLVYQPADTVEPRTWRFPEVTAVQTSSKTLQIKGRDRPLTGFRFENDSIFLWEQLLTEALRRFYRATGRGEIVELQPRIVAA